MDYIKELEALDYEVGYPNQDAMPAVIAVSGFGIASCHFNLNDTEALDSLIDADNHAERKYQFENPDETDEEREVRWAEQEQ